MTGPAEGARTALLTHLGLAVTTTCRAWFVTRKDGASYGFTDHDCDLVFEGRTFKARSGMTARALHQSTGLSVDNSEAVGALSDAAVDEADLAAGRFDGAEVRSWLVNWADCTQRIEQFRGNFGEVTRSGGAFKAELRGLTDRLNQPRGRVFQRPCAAVLGDAFCGVDLTLPGHRVVTPITGFDSMGRMMLAGLDGFAPHWFERGRIQVVTGAATGLVGSIKADRQLGSDRVLDLWHAFSAPVVVGDQVQLDVGCNRTAAMCQAKFANFLNFQGFAHMPGEDWLASYPVPTRPNDGGSLAR